MATINSHYFRVCTLGARRQGVDEPALLQAAGIAPAAIRDPLWRGSAQAMAELVRAIWRTLGDEFMGYTPAPVRPGAFELMTELALHSDSVAQAIEKGARFYNIVSPHIQTQVGREGASLWIEAVFAQPDLDPDHYFLEFWLIIWHRLACWLAGETVSMLEADFDYPRPNAYLEEFKYLFPCPQHFGAGRCRIRLDLPQLLGPVRRTHAEWQDMVAHAPLDLMTIPASDHSLTRRVRLLLNQAGPTALHSAEQNMADIAAAVDLPVETFRRQLRREGTTLTSIQRNILRDEAVRRLLEGNRTVEDIAAQLGYAEARSFTRAFRAWTGSSPSDYRKRLGRP